MSRLMDIKLRRGTAAAWTSANPILDAGEPGLETDTGRIKLGDGSTAWTSLGYLAGGDWNLVPGTLTYSSADSPTFVATTSLDLTGIIPVGARIKLTQTTAKYFIVTAIDATTITLYGGTDYTLANAAISSPQYSTAKAPIGFPLNPDKWTVEVTSTADAFKSSPANGTWYGDTGLTNTGPNISIPIGVWRVFYRVAVQALKSGSADAYATLSTASNTESRTDMTSFGIFGGTSVVGQASAEGIYNLAAKTTHYLNIATKSSSVTEIDMRGDLAKTVIRAVCAYL